MRMREPKTNNEWLQLERDVGRLFSAAPLSAVGSLGHAPREDLYLGRTSEIRLMVHAVRDPAKHILLYGERGLGKTSLANTFWRDSSTSGYPILAARVQVYPSDDFSSLWLRALEEFQTVFRHHNTEIRSNFAHVTPDIVRHEFQKLPRSLGAIMIVDEFDLLRDREARELTANLLKSLHDHAINVTILLIGVAENVDELIIDHRSLRRVLSLIKLERISTIDLQKILDSRLRLTPLEISEDARSEIVILSCGLPYYVQTLGRYAVQNALKSQRLQITTEDVKTAIDSFIFECGQSFADDYQRATESRLESNIFREVILASALALADAGGVFKSPEVAKTLDLIAPGQGYHHARVQQYLAQFASERRGGILIRSGLKPDYRYRFSDALMQPFVVMRAIKDGMIDVDLRHLLFHSGNEGDHDAECQLAVAAADATPFEMIIPTVAEERRVEIPVREEAGDAIPVAEEAGEAILVAEEAGGEIPVAEEAGGETSALSESRLARSKLGLHPGDGSVSGAVPGGSETATLAPRTRERSWRLFRR